jgi:hypothetical protein
MKKRQEKELPLATEEWGWKYHHLGIPTDKKMAGERYIEKFKFYVSGFETSPFGIEWMRFEDDSPFDELIKTIPHLAFVVQDLDFELANRGLKVIAGPNLPSGGVRVAMVEHNGAPIELMEFTDEYQSQK